MVKFINFIALLLFSTVFALTPIYATSHEAKEKEANTEEASASASEEGGEKKKKGDEEEEEPDCD